MDLREVFTPAAIAANWTEVASNQIPYLGATLFPARKKAGLDLSWLKGSRGLPVSLMPSALTQRQPSGTVLGLRSWKPKCRFSVRVTKSRRRTGRRCFACRSPATPMPPSNRRRVR